MKEILFTTLLVAEFPYIACIVFNLYFPNYRFWPPSPNKPNRIYAMALWFTLYYWCWFHLSKKVQFGFKYKLVISGPYLFCRNLIYIAGALIFIGFALICNPLYLYYHTRNFFYSITITPLIEEPWLLEQYGSEYESYCARVPRYISQLSTQLR